ncbi:MAG: hypothetical protein ACE1ZS_04690, partial [Candidatus Poribacteria bacterium]
IGLVLIKIFAASGAMGLVCWWTNSWIEDWIGVTGTSARLIGVFVPIGLGIGVLISGCKLLRVQELDTLLHAIRRRR